MVMTSTWKMQILTVILWLMTAAQPMISAFLVTRYNRLPGYAQISPGGPDFPHSSAAGDAPGAQQQQQPANQENLCSHCACTHLKATCDFQLNKTLSPDWDSKYRVSVKIKSIEVFLRPSIEFRLFENFFQDNQVNYFGVNGVMDNDRVEITRNAFSRNKGGYPNIEIRKVSQVYLMERTLSAFEFKLLVEDTNRLVVSANAFTMTNLDCTFRRIDDLQLNEKAFSHGGAQNNINLRVEDSNYNEIVPFDLSMSKVSFVRCNIGTIGRNAFDVTKIKELSFEHCNITTIKTQALTDKLHSENVSFVSTVIGTIEGEAINQSGITTLTLRGNTIDKIQTGAIRITAVYTFIRNNTVRHSEHDWLNVVQASQVDIENNRFVEFSRFEVNSAPNGALNCSFANNQLDDPQQGSLNFSRCTVHRISVGRICSCDGTAWWKTLTDHDLASEILCTLKSEDRSCFNATTVDRRRFEHEACGGGNGTTRHCAEGLWLTQSESDQLSGTARLLNIKWIASILVGVTLILILFIYLGKVCVSWLRPSGGGGGQGTMRKCSFPEEIQRQLLEAANELSENDETRRGVNKLIKDSPLTEEACMTRICEIINHISHKSSPIKDLLWIHSIDCHPSSRMLATGGGGDYGMSTIGGGGGGGSDNHHISAPSAPSVDDDYNDEHIYTELNQQQHPLIRSEYSELPPPAEDPYSEPFNATNANDMPPAYQYATPMRHPRPQQPTTTSTTSVCYATPVWRSTPSATPTSRPPSGAEAVAPRHVRDLRQDLEAMPQFHPNQLTRNQRQPQHQNYPQTVQQSQAQSQSQSHPLSQPQPQPQPHPPPYSQPGIRRHRSRQSFECLDGAASLAAMEHMDSGSDHSGGSDVTVQIADVIDYADA